jgi:fatty acid desaturase
MALQRYAPWRTSLLTPEQLRDLCQIRSSRMVGDTLLGWVGIFAAWTLVALFPAWWSVTLAIPVIGTRYYALFIVGHDGLHRRLFANKRANDFWNDLFIMAPIGAITRLNRHNHMTHHRELATATDPDRFKYVNDNRASRLRFFLGLTALPYVWKAVGNVFGWRKRDEAPKDPAPSEERAETTDGYRASDIALIAGWQAALIGGLTYVFGWWGYPVLWLLPVYVFTFAADIVRVFCEHSLPMNDRAADETIRLISFISNPVERQFFSPNNMNCHIAHHLWPAIPYYNLPEAERLVRLLRKDGGKLLWRNSYVAYIREYSRWLGNGRPGL